MIFFLLRFIVLSGNLLIGLPGCGGADDLICAMQRCAGTGGEHRGKGERQREEF